MKEAVTKISRELKIARDEAELVAATLLDKPRFALYLDDTEDPHLWEELRMKVALLKKGVPIEYVTKRVHFMDYSLIIEPGVFIPRLETEYFIELIARCRITPERILEIGTGTGCLAIALAHWFPGCTIIATDISERALSCAHQNVAAFGLQDRVLLVKSDVCKGLHAEFDMIISNPPYVPSSRLKTLPDSVRCYEPLRALSGGRDGCTVIREIVLQALPLLKQGGVIALEIDEDTAPTISDYLAAHSLASWTFHKDLFGCIRYLFIGDFGYEKSRDHC